MNQPHRNFPNINFKYISTREIVNIIKSLKAKGSYGYDEITTKVIKLSAPFISSPLSYIFNKSMLSGIFSTRLKYATIKPILKKENKENVANYRPISVLHSFSKILEKIICQTHESFGNEQYSSHWKLVLELQLNKLHSILLQIY